MDLSSEGNNRGKKKRMEATTLITLLSKCWEVALEYVVILFPLSHLFSSPVCLNNKFLPAVMVISK